MLLISIPVYDFATDTEVMGLGIFLQSKQSTVFTTSLLLTVSNCIFRVKRQLVTGNSVYIYDTDTDESSGNWQPWEQIDPCSRTCGGGVLVEQRKCQGDDCTGPTKRFSSCNNNPCPLGSKDFRQEQCSKFNSVPFERKIYEWVPYLKAPRKCELNCMPLGERFYYRHEKKVTLHFDGNAKE